MKKPFALMMILFCLIYSARSQDTATSFDWSLFNALRVVQTTDIITILEGKEQSHETSTIEYNLYTTSDGYYKNVSPIDVIIRSFNGVEPIEDGQGLIKYQIMPLRCFAYYDGTFFKWSGYDDVKNYLLENYSIKGIRHEDINGILEGHAINQGLFWKLLIEKWNNNYIYNGKKEDGYTNYVIRFGAKLPCEICLFGNTEYVIDGNTCRITYHGEAVETEVKRVFPITPEKNVVSYSLDVCLLTDTKTLIPFDYLFIKTIGLKNNDGIINYKVEKYRFIFSRIAF